MHQRARFICLSAILISSFAMAHVKPFATFSLGADSANFSKDYTNISFISSFDNSYVGTNSDDAQMLGGIFLGGLFNLNALWSWQWGASYYQNSPFQVRGDVYQFGDPAFNNLGYHYDITSHRLLLETKLLYTLRKFFHPYLDVGVGAAFNRASDYAEYAYSSDASPMSQFFGNHTTRSFAYVAGLGVDMDMSKHLRMGIGYRYTDLGKASLSTTPLQADTTTLQTNSITSHEFLFQISAIC